MSGGPSRRILVFTDHFRPEPSAPAAHVYERSRLWVAWGHRVTVVTSAPNFPEGRVYPGYRNAWRQVEELDGIRVVRVKTFMTANEGVVRRGLDYASYMASAGLQALGESPADVVFSTTPHLLVPCAARPRTLLRREPHVMEVRDLWPESILGTTGLRQGRAYRVLARLAQALYRSAAHVVALTPSIRDTIVATGVPPDRVSTVLNAANLDLFQPRPPDEAILREYGLGGRFVVGYVGTVGLAHGLESAIDAFERLKDSRATLFIVGVGAAKEGLEELVRARGLGNVVFAPRQLKEAVPAFWSVCSAALVHLRDAPVFASAIPSKIFEGMAMGLPILYAGPPSPGTALVEEHGAGLVVPPSDPAALEHAVRRLLADAKLRRTLAARSHAAAPRFSRETQARRTFEILETVIRRHRTGAA